MLRRIAAILSTVSLILCIGISVQWARSLWWTDYFAYHVTPSKTYQWASSDGRFCWAVSETVPAPQREMPVALEQVRDGTGSSGRLGTIRSPDGLPIGVHHTEAAYWTFSYMWVVMALGMPPFICSLFVHRARVRESERIARGQCAQCGYDLCASAGRCPECGTPIQHS